ncbi:MAG: BMP family ABC transporter substrate-binding protein [Selenomonadaceae bacterium]|nr:BMP family ABC transporter substrate-binding protein [Selenomonadaceae bacterium]MBQ1914661.1 BMP family ABC transporter substrate-binding protein [Selenomonadaceae bacterium]
MKVSKDELLAKRFFRLNACVTVVLLAAIVISVFQFGAAAWEKQQQIGLVLVGSKEDAGWNRAQYQGMQAACKMLGFELLLQENIREDEESCRTAVRELVERRAKVIFLANLKSLRNIGEIVKEYPNVQFFSTEMGLSASEIKRYAVRYIEPCYLAGILAGMRTKSGRIGYVAPYPSPESYQAINAFAIGVQRVKPDAQVLLVWAGGWENQANGEQAVRDFKAASVDVMAYFQEGETIPVAAERAGIYFISMYERYPSNPYELAAIQVDWKKAYSDLLRQQLRQFDRAAYWATILDRTVDIEPVKPALSARERAMFETEHWEIQHGKMVFAGEIYDRNGIRRCGADESISNQSLLQMNWLVKGVRVLGN